MDMNQHFSRHPDDEYIDEISIQMVPRYKTSGLSGDEWRVSARVQFKRKGLVISEKTVGSIEAAASYVPWGLLTFREEAQDPDWLNREEARGLCLQPGCSEPATIIYQLKVRYCREGHKSDPHRPEFRRFCARHARRGDCGLEDADENYTLIEGGPAQPPASDESEAGRAYVSVDNLEDLPRRIAQALDEHIMGSQPDFG